jgi:fructoselysine and glucoselysine-specific PTS system IIA component
MSRKIILASHGKFASGILTSLELICGKQADIIAMDCYITESFDLSQAVDQLMTDYPTHELIVITDVFGGGVNNEFLRYIKRPAFYLVAGLNLPFLIELVTKINLIELTAIAIEQALISAKESIQFCNDTINQEVEEEEF